MIDSAYIPWWKRGYQMMIQDVGMDNHILYPLVEERILDDDPRFGDGRTCSKLMVSSHKDTHKISSACNV